MSEKPASIEIMDQLAIEGWMPCWWDGDEVGVEEEATRREQWIVAGDVHLYTGRETVDDEWDERIWVDSLIGYPSERKERVPVNTLEELVSELAPFLEKYGRIAIHPVIKALMGEPVHVLDGINLSSVEEATRVGFLMHNPEGKTLMALCIDGDDRMYLGGQNEEEAHTVIDMMSGELVKCDAEVEDAVDFWMGILSLRDMALTAMGRKP